MSNIKSEIQKQDKISCKLYIRQQWHVVCYTNRYALTFLIEAVPSSSKNLIVLRPVAAVSWLSFQLTYTHTHLLDNRSEWNSVQLWYYTKVSTKRLTKHTLHTHTHTHTHTYKRMEKHLILVLSDFDYSHNYVNVQNVHCVIKITKLHLNKCL